MEARRHFIVMLGATNAGKSVVLVRVVRISFLEKDDPDLSCLIKTSLPPAFKEDKRLSLNVTTYSVAYHASNLSTFFINTESR